MEKDEAIKIAKSKKSSADQLKGLLGISDEIDLLLAKHLNTSAEMLDDICWRQSFDDKIAPIALVHPNLNVGQLLDVGIDYPLAAYKNPKFSELVAKDKKYLDQFDGEAFESSFKKELPGFVVEWLLSRGKAVYQLAYVSTSKRSPEELLKFRESKHPKVVAALLDRDIGTYLAWAADVGYEPAGLDQLSAADARVAIDRMISDVAQGLASSTGIINNKLINLSLPPDLFIVLKEIESTYFKSGRAAFSAEQTFYDDFVSSLQNFLENSSKFGGLVAKVIDYDLAEMKRFANPGKKFPLDITKASYYVKSGLERSFKRLMVALAGVCQKQPEARRIELSQALGQLVSANPLPSAASRLVADGNVFPLIPKDLLGEDGKFDISSMFANPALEQLVKNDPKFLDGFHGPDFEKTLAKKKVPEFVADWIAVHGDLRTQASFLFGSPRSLEIREKFRASKHPPIALQLLETDEATHLSWASELGFTLPPPDADEPVDVKWELENWSQVQSDKVSALWKDLVPKEGAAATLQGEVVRAMVRLESEFHRNGMMNWGDGSNFYENFTKLIHTTLKTEKSFSKVVLAVLDADIAAVKRSGAVGKAMASGKVAPEDRSPGGFLIESDVERSHERLNVLIAAWCERNPNPVPYQSMSRN
jgi:hypothetical protein